MNIRSNAMSEFNMPPGVSTTMIPGNKAKKKAKPCRCEAYPFPHRWLGGACLKEQIARDREIDESDRWLEDMMRRPRRNPDHYLDDPRHGQCKNGKFEG